MLLNICMACVLTTQIVIFHIMLMSIFEIFTVIAFQLNYVNTINVCPSISYCEHSGRAVRMSASGYRG